MISLFSDFQKARFPASLLEFQACELYQRKAEGLTIK